MIYEKTKNNVITIPNLLSFARLCMIPFIVWQYIFKQQYVVAAILVVVSGVTDIVDGMIARKFHMVSSLGKILDPVADKLTQIAILFCLIVRFHHMFLPLILLIVKETFAGVFGYILIKKTGVVNSAKWHGKISTVYLYTLTILHIVWFNIPPQLSDFLIGISMVLMMLSASLYTVNGMRSFARYRKSQI